MIYREIAFIELRLFIRFPRVCSIGVLHSYSRQLKNDHHSALLACEWVSIEQKPTTTMEALDRDGFERSHTHGQIRVFYRASIQLARMIAFCTRFRNKFRLMQNRKAYMLRNSGI